MASHATLASSSIPCNIRFNKKLEFAEFSGLRSSITFVGHRREASFSDVLAFVHCFANRQAARAVPTKGVTVGYTFQHFRDSRLRSSSNY
ncbi:glyceraldehyde-3-phosphate dehydrogenase B, chloroplastic-like isoform X1 [Zingiber officinale]|uniref:glyceraldehyde-3-phosphate dehydrogenase B, chloroplastic-like isoform X1 n=1 Tax=Zingiber officinale TaxID=94328 RepID=UPI001C4C7789|nr:glyceraldehyde-3-phosphate dehydrogenase B, chloroplastic-like isoform X1 [Zingiber officinale]